MATSAPDRPERRSLMFAVVTLGASGGVGALAYAAGRRLSPSTSLPDLPAAPGPSPTASGTSPAVDVWPDYTGQAWAQVRDRIPDTVRVTVRPVAADTSPVVLSQTPAPGRPRGESLTIVVRGRPTPVPLPDLPKAPVTGEAIAFAGTTYANSIRLAGTQAADGLAVTLPMASTRLSAAAWAAGPATGARATLIVEIGGRLRLRRVVSDRAAQPVSVQLAGARSVTIRADLPLGAAALVLGGPIVEVIR